MQHRSVNLCTVLIGFNKRIYIVCIGFIMKTKCSYSTIECFKMSRNECFSKLIILLLYILLSMVLHEEPIRLGTSPPCTIHLRAYKSVRDRELSGTQSLTPDREEILQPSPSNSCPDGRTSHQFQMDLCHMEDAQLMQLMGDLYQELVHRGLNVPPGTLHWAAGGLQQEMGTPL